MGEPVEVVEGPDSDISRLFPKCRPRSAITQRYSAFDSNAIYTQSNNTILSDLNRNCVERESDDNDNYEVLPTSFPTTIDEEVTSLGDDSSGSSASRMSVDSASVTPSSTPASHSSKSSHSNGIPSERNAELEADLSVVSAYRDHDDRFTSILDSSYEDSSGQRVVSPSLTSHQMPLATPHVLPQGRREHFRLRDSRIEAAGGREVFSQSRSRPSRRRQDETRRNHHYHHHSHYPNFPQQPHHSIQQQQLPQAQPQLQLQKQPQLPQLPREDPRRRCSSSSRSNSTCSNTSSGSRSSGSRELHDEERNLSASTAVGNNTSALVYETRLTGSSEVVFDDISDWVARGLTVKGVENQENVRRNIKKGFITGETYPSAPLSPPTPPSHSPSQSEHDSDYGEEGESPTHVTKIGNVPIADYEGSPRRYGQSQRPPRPGFPRRVLGHEENRSRASKVVHGREGRINNPVNSSREKNRPLLLPVSEKVQVHSPTQKQKPLIDIPNVKFQSHQETPNIVGSLLDLNKLSECVRPTTKLVEKDLSLTEERSEDESEASSLPPNAISISTLASSYASTFSQVLPTELTEPPPLPSLPEIYEGYGFEDSETRKVLEEFFLDTGKKRGRQQEFSDLEYVLKRQHGNSYVGQRLAAAECEDDKEIDDELCYQDQELTQEEQLCLQEHQRYVEERRILQEQQQYHQVQQSYSPNHVPEDQLQLVTSSSVNETDGKLDSSKKQEIINSGNETQPSKVQENGVSKDDTEQMGVSRNFTLSPETTSCDSLDVESEYSGGEPEGSLPSSGKVVSTMPVLEDGLSSGEESEMEVVANHNSKFFVQEEEQNETNSHQHIYLEEVEEVEEEPYLPENEEEELSQSDVERGRVFQRVRSLDEHLCRGEIPPMANSASNGSIPLANSLCINQTPSVIGSPPTSLPSRPPIENGIYQNSCSNSLVTTPITSSNFHEDIMPHATSSPHTKSTSRSKVSSPPHGVHSPSSSTLNLMKKQISEIEREIALKKPECGGLRKVGPEGEILPPSLDLHLLDPLNEKMGEPPPPPAPHPHRGNNSEIIENGSSTSTPAHTNTPASSVVSPSRVIGHLHSPQFTPVSGPVSGPQLLSTMGSLTSPIQIVPHMVPGHPATHDLHYKPGTGNGVSPSRESVEAAIADIKQAIRRTKNLPLKSHPQERHDKGPVWVPRNNRRDQQSSQQSSPTSTPQLQLQQLSPLLTQNNIQQQLLESSPSVGSTRSRDRSIHDEDDGDTDQETDRLLGQQRSDDTGFLDEKSWRRLKSRTAMPRTLPGEPKEPDSEGGGGNSNDSTPSTPGHHSSTNQMPSSPHDLVTSNKIKAKKDKEGGKKKGRSKEVLIEGVLFRARYLGSTQLVSEGQPTKTTRMMQAEEAVSRIKAPEGEAQPSTEVDLFISTEKIMVLNTDLKEIMMDHALRTISYIADIGDLVVLMARRRVLPSDDPTGNSSHRLPKMICHVFESDEAQFIAQSIGQAFQVAYLEFLKANGIEDHSFVKEMDYQEVLNSQEIFGDELQMFAKKELQKEVVVPKLKGEILGVVVVESGWGSMVPTVVIANLSPTGAAAKCGQLNIGDQIIAINGISLVGLPLSNCQNYIKNTKYNTAVKLTVVPCPPVVEVKIRRPDTKYQLGFSVQNGVICSLLRGGIAERGGVRVGHRIIDINSQSVVAVPHEKIVNLLATSVGEIRMKTMPTSIFRLLTGQETPQYI